MTTADGSGGGPRKDAFADSLALTLRARFPIVLIETFEESRILRAIGELAADAEALRSPRPLYVWSSTRGIRTPEGNLAADTTDPRAAVEWFTRLDAAAVCVMLDLHAHLGDSRRPADPALIRSIRELASAFQSGMSARSLIMVAPHMSVHPDLEKDITLLDFPLPHEAEVRAILDAMISTNARLRVDLDATGLERLAKAALGLTVNEASNAFARAMVNDGVLNADDIRVVMDEKRQVVRKSGLLEFVDVDIDLDAVGGLGNLKNWLSKRNGSWLADAREYGIPPPRGILMTGVPGCGKSLTAKAIAAAWEMPLLRMDVGKVFAGLVGSSEQNMRSVIRAAEAAAPCVLWIDEIEKGFGMSSGGGDSGTSGRVFGSFLTWMQEKTAPVFVIATANNADRLPAELLRKGRFDEIFFIDLPTAPERRAIWTVHLQNRLRNSKAAGLDVSETLLADLVAESEGYSGAEIEQAVLAGLFEAFGERRPMTSADLRLGLSQMIPLSVTQAEQVAAIRAWATDRAVSATSAQDLMGYGRSGLASSGALGTPGNEGVGHPDSERESSTSTSFARGGRMVDF